MAAALHLAMTQEIEASSCFHGHTISKRDVARIYSNLAPKTTSDLFSWLSGRGNETLRTPCGSRFSIPVNAAETHAPDSCSLQEHAFIHRDADRFRRSANAQSIRVQCLPFGQAMLSVTRPFGDDFELCHDKGDKRLILFPRPHNIKTRRRTHMRPCSFCNDLGSFLFAAWKRICIVDVTLRVKILHSSESFRDPRARFVTSPRTRIHPLQQIQVQRTSQFVHSRVQCALLKKLEQRSLCACQGRQDQ